MANFQKITDPGDIITGDVATEGQRLADLGYVPVAPDTSKLDSSVLGNTPQANYQTPEPTPVPDVSAIPSDTTQPELSKPQSDLQSMINELTSTNLTLEGDKQTFKTGLEKKAGLEEQMKAESDLSSQLKQLQAEATNIPNQLQLSAEGRGVTAGGLAPIQTARLRENSIKANTVGALLAATQGKIAFANSLIDRAVQAEFGPKEARQKALFANLDIIIKGPEYTEDEKRRALEQKKIQDAETAKIEQDKADRKSILDTATEAAKNGADSLTLQKISQAKTPEEALQNASGFMGVKKENTQIVEAGGRKFLIDSTTGDTIKDLGAVTETGKGTEIVEANGRKLLIDSSTGDTIKDLGIASSSSGADTQLKVINGEAFNYNKDTGELTRIITTPAGFTAEQIQTALDTQTTIDRILNNPNFSSAVGPVASRLPTIRAKTAEVEQDFATLQSLLALGNLNKLKGPMSDKDIQFLKDASSGISLKMSPEALKTRLNALKQRANVVNLKPGELQENTDGTYSYRNVDGTVHTGKLNDNYRDTTLPEIGENNDPLGLFSKVGGDTNKAVAMRTDRHNNPTAFTTDIAKIAGLKEGVDYVQGDSFSGGRYKTAKLLKDPISTTIKVIDKIGFQTQSGSPRWTYINIPKKQWDNMSYSQKKQTIAKMYQHEGGSQLRNLFA